MENFIIECARTGALFRNSEIHQGSNRLVNLIDNIPFVLSSLPPDYIPQANAALSEALNAFEQRDFVTLSDILAQKLPAMIFHGLHGKSAIPNDSAKGHASIKPLEEEVVFKALFNSQEEKLNATYSGNVAKLKKCNYHGKIPSYEELSTFFVGDSEVGSDPTFTFYTQEEGFIGKEYECVADKQLALDEIPRGHFGDCLLLDSWNIFDFYSFAQDAKQKGKKAYIGIGDSKKFFGMLQGISIQPQLLEGAVIFDTPESLKDYFYATDQFLPRHILGSDSAKAVWEHSIQDVHNKRINNESGTNQRKNVILSIAIPTYNRGKRALDSVRLHLNTCYDEEIEIVVSNNGTKNETKTYYDKISQISDTRLKYHEFDENQGLTPNCCKVCEMATGRYVLLLSDEDHIQLENLPKILNILHNDSNISVVRTATKTQGTPFKQGRSDAGEKALLNFMLTSNYISGNIYNLTLLKSSGALEYTKNNLDNGACFIYPHMVWELFVGQHADILGLNTILACEGKAEKNDFGDFEIGKLNKIKMPSYATIQNRIEQHIGFKDAFLSMPLCTENFTLLRTMYLKLCHKTAFLAQLSLRVYYSNTDHEQKDIMLKVLDTCIRGLEELYVFINGKKTHKNHKNDFDSDMVQINKIFKSFC